MKHFVCTCFFARLDKVVKNRVVKIAYVLFKQIFLQLMRFGPGRSAGLLQDSTGSVIVQDGQQEDTIQMNSLADGLQ